MNGLLLMFVSVLPSPALASAVAEPARTLAEAVQPARAQGAVSIRVHPGDWGAADTRDIARVLSFAADLLAPAFPRHAGDIIDVAYSPRGPLTEFKRRPDGGYRVYLTVHDSRWDQFTYQFSHEYCHIVSNAEQRVYQDAALRGTQWFEESMCEAVALVALQRAALRWSEAPPVAAVPGYANAFRNYADYLINQAHRRAPAGASAQAPLEMWYAVNHVNLQTDPYLRTKNEVVAGMLYGWLRGSPDALESIGYLGVEGLHPGSDDQAFAAYLERWRDASPVRLRGTVTRVPALFGIAGQDLRLTVGH